MGSMPKVLFTKKITPESLIYIYEALRHPLVPKIAVKISTGESEHSNHLRPELILPLVQRLNGDIVECNTAYEGNRDTTEKHLKVLEERGYTEGARCVILDDIGDMSLPVNDGIHLQENYVGKKLNYYNGLLMLSHFKGHPMAGFGGALKNMSIGLASSRGKVHIHTGGRTFDREEIMNPAYHMDFLESMADACMSVMDYMGRGNIVYINVANRLSVDCDCVAEPEPCMMPDIGIFASLDPVALDQACLDAVYECQDQSKGYLIERYESRNGGVLVDTAAKLRLGSPFYQLVSLD